VLKTKPGSAAQWVVGELLGLCWCLVQPGMAVSRLRGWTGCLCAVAAAACFGGALRPVPARCDGRELAERVGRAAHAAGVPTAPRAWPAMTRHGCSPRAWHNPVVYPAKWKQH